MKYTLINLREFMMCQRIALYFYRFKSFHLSGVLMLPDLTETSSPNAGFKKLISRHYVPNNEH